LRKRVIQEGRAQGTALFAIVFALDQVPSHAQYCVPHNLLISIRLGFKLPLAVFGFVFGDEIVKDLTLLFVGRFRKSLSEQFQVLIVSAFVHDRVPRYTRESTSELQSPMDFTNVYMKMNAVCPRPEICGISSKSFPTHDIDPPQ
jgi:hypothetical protein